jgi:hypothetical protein
VRTRIANVIAAILCVLQLLAMAVAAVWTLAESARTVAGNMLILVVASILAAAAFGVYFLRHTLRMLGIGQPSPPEDEGGLAVASILAGLAVTATAGVTAIAIFVASIGESPPRYYWALIGGIWFSIFTLCAWIWWGSIVLGQILLRAGRKSEAFAAALSAPILAYYGIQMLLSYGLFR